MDLGIRTKSKGGVLCGKCARHCGMWNERNMSHRTGAMEGHWEVV